jgi:hypothetical protein
VRAAQGAAPRAGAIALVLSLFGYLACQPPPLMHPAPAASAPAPSAPPPSALDPARRLLEREAAIAIAEGSGPLEVLASDYVSAGDRIGAFVDLGEGSCLLAYARGSEGVDDLDLLSFSDEGAPLAIDEAPDPRPAVILCPPMPGRAHLSVRVAAGKGLVALGGVRVPFEVALRVSRALRARGRPGAGGREVEAWPGLDAKVEGQRRSIGGRWEEIRRVALPVDASAPGRASEPIEAGRCVAALVTPSDETSEIDVQLLDGEGRILGRALELGRDRVAIVCASLGTQAIVEVKPRIGGGVVALVLSRSVAGSEADIAARAERLDAFAAVDLARAQKQLGELLGPGAVAAQARGEARTGRRASVEVALPAGCARIDAVGGTPLAGLAVDAWSTGGELLGRAEGGARATVFVCGAAGKARVDVEAQQRPGPFAIEVRAEAGADPALTGLAASRLLGRLNVGSQVVRASSLQLVRSLSMDGQSLRTVDLRVPEGRCLDVAAAVGAGGTGVDLRLVDRQGGEIVMAHAAWATATRVCAGATARAVQAEVRLGSGKAEVLVGAAPGGPGPR